VRIHLEESARVSSAPASLQDSAGQRRRWEHGFLQTAAKNALPMLAAAVRSRSRHQLALALHLMIPPLALLYLIAGASLAATFALGFVTNHWWPAIALLAAAIMAGVATVAAWAVAGRRTLAFGALLQAPLYVLWKLPIYVGYLVSRQAGWNRTRREGET
jgi:cellulose synthase/poly-beta-1,6-N-acetylglucosamine synthase-like glycosyltransferase